MALTRLFIDGALLPGQVLVLENEQAHYIGRALRLRAGDALSVFNAESGEFAAVVESVSKSSATLQVGAHVETATESPLKLQLVQGVSRGDRMDFVVQKATELGAKRITPVLTEYSMVKLDGSRAEKRRAHWQKVAISACEQSGRIRPPLIDPPVALKSWFGSKTQEADVDLILKPGANESLTSLTAPRTKVCLLVGPEGGFSDTEYDDADVSGFKPVSLGPRILRTETAALAALTIAEALWGDIGL